MRSEVEDWSFLAQRFRFQLFSNLRGEQRVQLLQVDDLPLLPQIMEVSHTDLSKVTRMVLVHVDSVVVLTSGKTSTTRMLPVLTDSTVTGRDVTPVLSCVVLNHVNPMSSTKKNPSAQQQSSPVARQHDLTTEKEGADDIQV